jgi:hypothetical protein
MEASLTAAAAAASSPPPQIRTQITKLSPLLSPWRRQFGPSKIRTASFRRHLAAASASTPPATGGGLYSAATYELTADNVDRVLDDVRPYLISDGGDVAVVSVEDGIVSLRLEGKVDFSPCAHIKFHGQNPTGTSNLNLLPVVSLPRSRGVQQLSQLDDDDEHGHRARAQGEVR